MSPDDPVLNDLPMPIRTPRLLLRPKQPGDGAATSVAVAETWDELHQWMRWAEDPAAFTPQHMEIRDRQMMASYLLRQVIELIGIEIASAQPVVWCGLHDIDWPGRQCEAGYWVRRGSQNQGFATEASNALLRYAFGPLEMRRVGLTHAAGNHASRRVAEKLGFFPEGVQRAAAILPQGRIADRHCYAIFDTSALPSLDVRWGSA